MKQIWNFFTSLRLTVVCLVLSIVLVFVGTVAQADEGLYQAQTRYFKQWWVLGATMWGHHLPIILPGGRLLGTLLLTNLVAAHIKRFKWGWSKVGIHLTHAGIVILLLGQLATDLWQVESRLTFNEGERAQYVEDHREHELVFARDADAGQETVVAIPAASLVPGNELTPPGLPFAVRVKSYAVNAEVRQRAPMVDKGDPPATQGIGAQVTLTPQPQVLDMDRKDLPAAVIEIVGDGQSRGTWLASPFLRAQEITAGSQIFRMTLRDRRTYLPYGLKLVKATHKKYPGSDMPKDFRSRVLIDNPSSHENREVEISMNNPLRYSGLAFFQYQMTKDEFDRAPGSSVLQVVANPSWVAPYIGCLVVSAGMLWQFLHHLMAFIAKRKGNPEMRNPNVEIRNKVRNA